MHENRLRIVDACNIALLMIGTWLYSGTLDFNTPPVEDACMLLRYSQHLADGQGIVWNRGEDPVDGATDFLFMVTTAGIAKAGFNVLVSARAIGIISHVMTILIIYLAVIAINRAGRTAALLSAAYFAIGPGLDYVSLGFGTPFFALFAAITWCFANVAADSRESLFHDLAFALSGLILGLIRPEGVILASLMLASIVYIRGLRGSYRTVGVFFGVFGLLGGAYFLWRWWYFGYPLPNPFYKKGGGHLYPDSVVLSIKYVYIMTYPFICAFLVGFLSRKTIKQTVFALIPTVGFTLVWILLSNEMNWAMRFQYAALPLVLISWPVPLRGLRAYLGQTSPIFLSERDMAIASLLIASLLPLSINYGRRIYHTELNRAYLSSNIYLVATALAEFSAKSYTVATTEAGLIPLYSNWNAMDTYGLNDAWIAHHGGITEAYLDEKKPHVIVVHADFCSRNEPDRVSGDAFDLHGWRTMVGVLLRYAKSRHYVLAADYGWGPFDSYYYYVRPGFADSEAIIRKIRDLRAQLGEKRSQDYSLPDQERVDHPAEITKPEFHSTSTKWAAPPQCNAGRVTKSVG